MTQGLVIPALDGFPGLYSARYAGVNASDQDNVSLLLERMKTSREIIVRGAISVRLLSFATQQIRILWLWWVGGTVIL